jgi:hypothetical protein
MRETEPTHWPQCHFSRWLTWFTNVCSDAQFGPFDLSIAFWESGFLGFVWQDSTCLCFTAAIIILLFAIFCTWGVAYRI